MNPFINSSRASRPRGMTLLEIIIVLLGIAVLVTVSVPAYQWMKARSLSTACLSNLRSIGSGLSIYLGEHNMTMPVIDLSPPEDSDLKQRTLPLVLADYVDAETFRCPADDRIFEQRGSSYFWNPLLNGQSYMNLSMLFLKDETSIPMVTDIESFHEGVADGVNVLYADGHAQGKFEFRAGR